MNRELKYNYKFSPKRHFRIAAPTIPLDETPDIRTGNALQMDWEALPSASGGEAFSYILGNPPFIGCKMMDNEQREEQAAQGVLDVRARYLTGRDVACNVSTTSLTDLYDPNKMPADWGTFTNPQRISKRMYGPPPKESLWEKGQAARCKTR